MIWARTGSYTAYRWSERQVIWIVGGPGTGVASLIIEQNSANSGAGMAALVDALATLSSAANDDLNGKVLAVDVYRPSERYLHVNCTSGTANIAFGSVTAIRYGQRKVPMPDTAAIGDMVPVTSPLES